ncbi:MAG: carboxypeptidase regulatory-like domain-containing protein, partial [Thermoanaerobaculia bacterium]
MKRRTLTIALLLVLLPASLLLAGAEGRLKGTVMDKDGNPIIGADVLLQAQEVSVKRQATTKKGGKFVMIVADASRTYTIRIEKEGYQTIHEPVKLTVGGQLIKEWVMHQGQTVQGPAFVEVQAPGSRVYNEGAKAFNNGDVETALAKFREAGELNPELAEAFQGQAMIHWSRKETDAALVAAERTVALDPENAL